MRSLRPRRLTGPPALRVRAAWQGSADAHPGADHGPTCGRSCSHAAIGPSSPRSSFAAISPSLALSPAMADLRGLSATPPRAARRCRARLQPGAATIGTPGGRRVVTRARRGRNGRMVGGTSGQATRLRPESAEPPRTHASVRAARRWPRRSFPITGGKLDTASQAARAQRAEMSVRSVSVAKTPGPGRLLSCLTLARWVPPRNRRPVVHATAAARLNRPGLALADHAGRAAQARVGGFTVASARRHTRPRRWPAGGHGAILERFGACPAATGGLRILDPHRAAGSVAKCTDRRPR